MNISSPVSYLKNVSENLGCPVWIKREDLMEGSAFGGSKVRKLNQIFPVAEKNGVTDIITAGTTGSHHIHAVSVMGRERGFTVHAVLAEQTALEYPERVFELTKLENPNITYSASEAALPVRMFLKWLQLKRKGRKPMMIGPGGLSIKGVEAYADAGLELYSDLKRIQAEADVQVCVYGTGGITAGLQTAKQIHPELPSVYAVQVYPGFWNGRSYIKYFSSRVKNKYFYKKYNDHDLIITDRYIGDGYGTESIRCREAVSLFQKEAIFLDPVYMARAGQAVIDLSKTGRIQKGILLWYTAPRLF